MQTHAQENGASGPNRKAPRDKYSGPNYTSQADHFKQAIRDYGLNPPDHIEPGRVYKFPGRDKVRGNDAARCKLFDDMRGGWFADWSNGGEQHFWWASGAGKMSDAEREEYRREAEESRKRREVEDAKRRAEAARKAAEILDAATDIPGQHAYAVKKELPLGPLVKRGPWTQRGWDDALLVPLYDARGAITTVEAISSSGEKDFLVGGRKSGSFHPIGKIRGAKRVYIAEGLATAAIGAAVDDAPAVAAMDAGNLSRTAETVRGLAAPGAEIIFLADDDRKADGSNPGMKAAMEAAALVGGIVVKPEMNRTADFWDVWQALGADAVRERIKKAVEAHHQGAERTYKLLSFSDLANLPPMRWKVKGLFPESGTAAIYGPAGSGKSFLAFDLAGALADGREWFGRRVIKSPVVYLCLEGEGGLRNRAAAYRSHHSGHAPSDVHIIAESFDILTNDTAALIRTIQSAGLENPVIVIDTLNRAAPGADENSSIDMGRIIAAAKGIQKATDGLVIVVHHSGKDASKDLRGHSSLRGALDTVIAVKRDGDSRTWTTAASAGGKVKDGSDDIEESFSLKVYNLGEDEDGDPITSCAVVPGGTSSGTGTAKREPLGKNAAKAVDILADLYEQHRSNLAESGKNPGDAKVTFIEWCSALAEVGKMPKNRASEARTEALRKRYVKNDSGIVKLVPEVPPGTENGTAEPSANRPSEGNKHGSAGSELEPNGTGTDEVRFSGSGSTPPLGGGTEPGTGTDADERDTAKADIRAGESVVCGSGGTANSQPGDLSPEDDTEWF